MPDTQEIYVFRAGLRGELGFTYDNTGSNLPGGDPADPWAHVYTVEPGLIRRRTVAANMKAIAARISSEGCFIARDAIQNADWTGLC